jgi:phytoene synthase
MEEVFSGKQTPNARPRSVDRRGAGASRTAFEYWRHVPPQVRPVFLPLALVRRDLVRMARADVDPFVPQAPSRLRILWTLWRASRSREFGG